jgi:magnesium transporter
MITISKYSKENILSQIPSDEFKSWDKSNSDDILWIDMCNPKISDATKILKDIFNFHPLVIEDSIKYLKDSAFHFPKIDEFNEYLFIVFNEIDPNQKHSYNVNALSCYIGNNFLITVHTEKTEHPFKRFLNVSNTEIYKRGPDYLLHLLLDEIVDKYYPLLDNIEDEYEKVEEEVFKKKPENTSLLKILNLKKDLLRIRRISSYQRDILFKLSRGDYKFVNLDEAIYYRNVFDHLVNVTDTADTYRDLVTGLLDSYLSIVNNNLNQIIKVLTIFAAIMMPLTLFTGIFGMNFEHIPLLENEYGFFISLGLMILIIVLMLAWFKKEKWF